MVLIYPSRLMTTKNLRQPCALCKLKSPKKQCRIQGTSYAMASVVGSRVAGSLLLAEKIIGLLYYNRSFVLYSPTHNLSAMAFCSSRLARMSAQNKLKNRI